MKICPNCFSDKELKAFVSSSKDNGNCGICKSTNVPLLDSVELLDFFEELIANYESSKDGQPLIKMIQEQWSFFSSDSIASHILNEFLHQLSTDISTSNDLVIYTFDILENYKHWDKLIEELKWSNRFISDIDYLVDLGWDGFFNTQFELYPKNALYRARVHHQSRQPAYEPSKMMTPEPIKAKGGRANPLGIPYLYLSDNPDTVLYEVRASYLDELSIGTYNLKSKYSSVKIVDFTEETPLFQPSRVNETIKARILRERISEELSKPMRRYDSEIEYIPTQFICEFIKVFTGASGIQFRSSIHPSGKNLVIFDQDLIECVSVELKRVTELNLKADKI